MPSSSETHGNGSLGGIDAMLRHLGVSGDALQILINDHTRQTWPKYEGVGTFEHLMPGLAEILPMLAPYMLIDSSRVVKVKSPMRQKVQSPLVHREGFVSMLALLGDVGAAGRRTRTMEEVYTRWKGFPAEFLAINGYGIFNLGTPLGYYPMLKECHDYTTAYFASLSKERRFRLDRLVGAHVSMAAKVGNERKGYEPGGFDDKRMLRWMIDRCKSYVQNIGMVKVDGFSPDEVRDAWWVLMLRCFTWSRAVCLVRDESPGGYPVRSDIFDSPIPVYLT